MYRSKLLGDIRDDARSPVYSNRLILKATQRRNKSKIDLDSLRTMGAEEIRELLRQENVKFKESEKSNIFLNTRDVSHLKDKLKRNSSGTLPALPSDIDHLKKLMESTDFIASPILSPHEVNFPNHCIRENCLDFVIEKKLKHPLKSRGSNSMVNFDFISQVNSNIPETPEWLDLGNPSGRQEVVMLKDWYEKMNKTYDDPDQVEMVFSMCCKEMIRQVTVQCKERGDLLKELLSKEPGVYQKKEDKMLNYVKEIEEKHSKEIEEMKNLQERAAEDHNKESQEWKSNLKTKDEIISKLKGDIRVYKLRWKDSIRSFNEQQELWNKKFNEMAKLSKKHSMKTTGKNENTPISVVNWRQNARRRTNIRKTLMNMAKENSQSKDPSVFEKAFGGEPSSSPENLEYKVAPQDQNVAENKINDKEIQVEFEELLYEVMNDQSAIMEEPDKEIFDTSNIKINVLAHELSFRNSIEPPLDPTEKIMARSSTMVRENPISQSENEVSSEMSFTENHVSGPTELKRQFTNQVVIIKEAKTIEELDNTLENNNIPTEKNNEDAASIADQSMVSNISVITEHNIFQSGLGTPMHRIGSFGVRYQTMASEDLEMFDNEKIFQSKMEEIGKLDKEIELRKQFLEKMNKDIEMKKQNVVQSLLSPLKEVKRRSISVIPKIPESLSNISIQSFADLDLETIRTLIPDDGNKNSWKDGFLSGIEFGKSQGFTAGENLGKEEGQIEGYVKALNEKTISESYFSSESDYSEDEESNITKEIPPIEVPEIPEDRSRRSEDFSRRSSSSIWKSQKSFNVSKDKKYYKETTKFDEFNFHHPVSHVAAHKKSHYVFGLFGKMMSKSLEKVKKRSSMSFRLVNKLLASIYQVAFQKLKADETFELLELAFDEFDQRYKLKTVCDKKFLDFMASLFVYSEQARSEVFLRFLECGDYIKKGNYSRVSLSLYLNCLHHMLISKVGIMTWYEESAEHNMFPINRAYECIKEKLDFFERSVIQKIQAEVESKNKPDPKRINACGLIDLEIFLQIIVDHYEDFQKKIEDGIEMLVKAVGYGVDGTISKRMLFILIRHILKQKISIPAKDEDIDYENTKLKDLASLFQNEVVMLEELVLKCIDSNLFSLQDVRLFYSSPPGFTFDNAREKISNEKENLFNIISVMKNNENKKWKSLPEDEWEERLRACELGMNAKNFEFSMLAWSIYKVELKRIENEYLKEAEN